MTKYAYIVNTSATAKLDCAPEIRDSGFDEINRFWQHVFMTKDTKRAAILDAANQQFRQYGYRKTSMDDISARLGISRASIYSYFDNKDDVFRSVSIAIHEQALLAAECHLLDTSETKNLSLRIENALLARHGPFHKAVIQSVHGSELFDEYGRLCGDIVLDSHMQFQDRLCAALEAASRSGEINFKTAGVSAAISAELLDLAAAGLKRRAPDSGTFENRVRALVKVFVAGLS
jgi:AcrR family transcriptional regulator